LQNLRKTHDLLLQTYRKVKSGKVSKDALIAHALDSGFIDRVDDIFLNAISNNSESLPEWDWKPHWGMIETLLREADQTDVFNYSPGLVFPFADTLFEGLHVQTVTKILDGTHNTPTIAPYVRQILEIGALSITSPFTGDEIKSRKGLFFYFGGKPYIIYVFFDIEPILIFANPNLGDLLACYFPARRMLIGKRFSYARVIVKLKALCVRYASDLCRYFADERSEPVLTSSFMQHTGHTLLNEISGFDTAILEIENFNKRIMLLGPHEYLDFARLFPEFDRSRMLKVDLGKKSEFLLCLENSYLPVRPTLQHYLIKETLRNRLREFLNCNSKISFGAMTSNVVWIEVRSNHRVWLNQVDAIRIIITKLIDHYPNVSVFIAGWSLPADPSEEDNVQIRFDMKIYKEVAEFAAGRLPVICGVGLSSEEKLRWAFRCSASVVTFGSGMTLPCLCPALSQIYLRSFTRTRIMQDGRL